MPAPVLTVVFVPEDDAPVVAVVAPDAAVAFVAPVAVVVAPPVPVLVDVVVDEPEQARDIPATIGKRVVTRMRAG